MHIRVPGEPGNEANANGARRPGESYHVIRGTDVTFRHALYV